MGFFLHLDLWRGRRFHTTDRLAPVLPLIIYTGVPPWDRGGAGDRPRRGGDGGTTRGRILEQGRAQGEARGIVAQRTRLQRQASRKFGSRADARLAPLLADIGNLDALATVAEWIIDCDTFEELLDRPRGLA